MSDTEKEPIIALEGTDGAGKNTVSIALIETLLNSSEYNVLHTSFPSYWAPHGTLIRYMNRGLSDEYAKEKKLSLQEELSLRTSMYALDRALTFLVIEQIQNEMSIN